MVSLDERGITLRRYYFLVLSKRIAYPEVRGFEERPMGVWTGKGRIGGSGDLRHWAPLDLRRPHKGTKVILDLGGRVRPVFSPEDPRRVMALLREHAPNASRSA